MIATLQFTLPDEREEFEECQAAHRYRAALTEISETLRAQRKYDGPPFTEERFYTILKYQDVTL